MTYLRSPEQENERDTFKLTKRKEKKSGDLDRVKCIKSDKQKVLVKDNDIKERQRENFNKLLNEDYMVGLRMGEDFSFVGYTFYHKIGVVEVKKALKQI